jgi:hypothetical protein
MSLKSQKKVEVLVVFTFINDYNFFSTTIMIYQELQTTMKFLIFTFIETVSFLKNIEEKHQERVSRLYNLNIVEKKL